MMRRLIVSGILLAAGLGVAATPHATAANHPFIYRAAGWTLTLTGGNASYGSILHGSLVHAKKSYQVEGDWIPAGDAGGDLLRFYGRAFGTIQGLVSVATLYSTCNPNCAAAKTYDLKPLGPWTLPGMNKQRAVRLTLHP